VRESEPRLRCALVAAYGFEEGRDATAAAFAYAWVYWARVRQMPNALGYLFRVAPSRRRRRRVPVLYDVAEWPDHLFEPGLPDALAALSCRQRLVVVLVHGLGYTLHEGAEVTPTREMSERRTARTDPIPRAAGRRRVIFAGAGVGLAAAGCAAGLVIASASP